MAGGAVRAAGGVEAGRLLIRHATRRVGEREGTKRDRSPRGGQAGGIATPLTFRFQKPSTDPFLKAVRDGNENSTRMNSKKNETDPPKKWNVAISRFYVLRVSVAKNCRFEAATVDKCSQCALSL